MDGFDYKKVISSFRVSNNFQGRWENDMVALNVGDNSLAFEYHGQCVYFYPVKKISHTEFEMIWARDMDCKFDNHTSETFGLTSVPIVGKAFARFRVENDSFKVIYYYPHGLLNIPNKFKKMFLAPTI